MKNEGGIIILLDPLYFLVVFKFVLLNIHATTLKLGRHFVKHNVEMSFL